MQRYGKLINGELLTSDHLHLDYKPIEYEALPTDFNQELHYAVQQPPVDYDDYIYLGLEVKELQLDDVEDANLEYEDLLTAK